MLSTLFDICVIVLAFFLQKDHTLIFKGKIITMVNSKCSIFLASREELEIHSTITHANEHNIKY